MFLFEVLGGVLLSWSSTEFGYEFKNYKHIGHAQFIENFEIKTA